MVTLALLGDIIAYFVIQSFVRMGTSDGVERGKGERPQAEWGWPRSANSMLREAYTT